MMRNEGAGRKLTSSIYMEALDKWANALMDRELYILIKNIIDMKVSFNMKIHKLVSKRKRTSSAILKS